jgi:hypothetical protein
MAMEQWWNNTGSSRQKKLREKVLCAFFWVIPLRLNFICQRFGRLCQFHSSHLPTYEDGRQSVPKRLHIKFRRWEITQKRGYNIQNTAKV